jgi:hypothetical protein
MNEKKREQLLENIRKNPESIVKLLEAIADDHERGDHGKVTLQTSTRIVQDAGFASWFDFVCETRSCFY